MAKKTSMREQLKKGFKWLHRIGKTEVHPVWFMLVWILLSFYGCYVCLNGFHNLDICQNFEDIESNVNCRYKYELNMSYNLKETTISGEVMELDECYRIGLHQARAGIVLMVVGFLLMGVYFEKIRRST